MKYNTKKLKFISAAKAVNYLSNHGWDFDDMEDSVLDFANAFDYGDKNSLGFGIASLLKEGKNWAFYSIKDICLLEESRKIYRKNLLKLESKLKQ